MTPVVRGQPASDGRHATMDTMTHRLEPVQGSWEDVLVASGAVAVNRAIVDHYRAVEEVGPYVIMKRIKDPSVS